MGRKLGSARNRSGDKAVRFVVEGFLKGVSGTKSAIASGDIDLAVEELTTQGRCCRLGVCLVLRNGHQLVITKDPKPPA